MMKSLFQKEKDRRVLTYLLALCGIYVLPIILAGVNYRDDYSRNFLEDIDWNGDGRLIATLIYKAVSLTDNIIDISPLTQILSIANLALSAFLVYKIFLPNARQVVATLSCFVFVSNPFFIDNLTFKYDSLTMSTGFLLVTTAFYFSTKKGMKNILISLALLTCALLSYQPLLTVYVGLAFVYFLQKIVEDKPIGEAYKMLATQALVVIVSFVIYFLISAPFISGWIASKNTPIALDSNLFTHLKLNLKKIFWVFSDFFYNGDSLSKKVRAFLLIIIPFALAYIKILLAGVKWFRKDKNHFGLRALSLLMILFSPFILFFIVTIPILPLVNPVLEYRVFVGFSVVLLFCYLYSFSVYKGVYVYITAICALQMMVYPYVHANNLKVLQTWQSQTIKYIESDINYLEGMKRVIVNKDNIIPTASEKLNNEYHSPAITLMNSFTIRGRIKEFSPMLSSIEYFKIYEDILGTDPLKTRIKEAESLAPINENSYYKLQTLNDTIAIYDYKEQKPRVKP